MHRIEVVNNKPEIWKNSDPVRPNLGVSYKTHPGRDVYGLVDNSGKYISFCCIARTLDIPIDIMSLSRLTSINGSVCVPYTVWSLQKGAGKKIINQILILMSDPASGIERIVTLSPRTEMARSFHLRNGAKEIATNIVTANFEYELQSCQTTGQRVL